MKIGLILIACFGLTCCNSLQDGSKQLVMVNHKWLDSVMHTADTSFNKKYGTIKFAKAEYYFNRKDSIICQVMKDSSDSVRQIIITNKNKRSYFAEYYPNGQLIAQLPLDSFGQYHGYSKYYYQNGLIESEGDYKNGLKTGEWKNYNISGKMISISGYDTNGQAVKTIPNQ